MNGQLDLLAYGARTSDPETSHQAATRARHTAEDDRQLVERILHEHGPCTDHEIAGHAGRLQTSLGVRRGELVKFGKVQYAGYTRLSPSGSPAHVWQLIPGHLIANPGDRYTLCGLKDAYPHTLAKFKTTHDEGVARVGKPAPVWCQACVTAMETA